MIEEEEFGGRDGINPDVHGRGGALILSYDSMIVSNMKPLARTGSGWRMEGVGGVHESTGTSKYETSFSSLGFVGCLGCFPTVTLVGRLVKPSKISA